MIKRDNKLLRVTDQRFVYCYFEGLVAANDQQAHAIKFYESLPNQYGVNGKAYCIGPQTTATEGDFSKELGDSIARLVQYANKRPNLYFYVAEVRSGLLSDEQCREVFVNIPHNLILPASVYKALHPEAVRICVAGSRFFFDYPMLEKVLDQYLAGEHRTPVIISGGAPGADTLAERYCKKRGIKNLVIDANWSLLKRKAGPLRNESMMWLCHELVAFKDSREHSGTAGMISLCQSNQRRITVVPV